jgi:hypothetical protein
MHPPFGGGKGLSRAAWSGKPIMSRLNLSAQNVTIDVKPETQIFIILERYAAN